MIELSQENQKTLEVYAERYGQYAANEVAHKQKNPEKAAIKRAKLETFIRNSFAPLGPGAKIIEIGAAMGEDARYLASLGYDVTATDAVNGFLSEIAKDGPLRSPLEGTNADLILFAFFQLLQHHRRPAFACGLLLPLSLIFDSVDDLISVDAQFLLIGEGHLQGAFLPRF